MRGGKTPVRRAAPRRPSRKSRSRRKSPRSAASRDKRRRSRAWPSPDGKRAPLGESDNSVRLWDVEGGKEIRRSDGHPALVASVPSRWMNALSPALRQKRAAVGRGQRRRDRRFEGHVGRVTSVAFSAHGERALSGSWDRTLRLWDVESGKELQVLKRHTAEVRTAAFLPDGQHALSGGWYDTIRLWDLKEATEIRQFKGDMGVVTSVAVSSDGLHALSRDGEDRVPRRGI